MEKLGKHIEDIPKRSLREGASLGIPEGLGVPEQCWRSLRGHDQGTQDMTGLAPF